MRHSAEAERAVIAAMLFSREARDEVMAILTTEDFAIPSHRLIVTTIFWLHGHDRGVDTMTVAHFLEGRGKLDEIGGKGALIDIAGQSPTTQNVVTHARIVFREAVFRRLHGAGMEITEISADDEVEAVAQASKMVESALGPNRIQTKSVRGLLTGALERYENPPDTVTLKEWDIWLDEGDVMTIGARPSVGKTALLVGEALRFAERHLKCRIYSYEMSDIQILGRLVAMTSGIESSALRKGLGASDIARVSQAMGQHFADFIDIEDSILSIDRLVADMRRFANSGGRVAVIDYLQLIGRQDTETATENSRRIKIAAGQTGLIVLQASQLSRDGKQQDGTFRKPSIGDLRQTGAIEQDSDVVALLHRFAEDDVKTKSTARSQGWLYDRDMPGRHLSQFDLVKARNGQGKLGVRMAWFEEKSQIWTQLDREVGP